MCYQVLGLDSIRPPGSRVKDPLHNRAGGARSRRRIGHSSGVTGRTSERSCFINISWARKTRAGKIREETDGGGWCWFARRGFDALDTHREMERERMCERMMRAGPTFSRMVFGVSSQSGHFFMVTGERKEEVGEGFWWF